MSYDNEMNAGTNGYVEGAKHMNCTETLYRSDDSGGGENRENPDGGEGRERHPLPDIAHSFLLDIPSGEVLGAEPTWTYDTKNISSSYDHSAITKYGILPHYSTLCLACSGI